MIALLCLFLAGGATLGAAMTAVFVSENAERPRDKADAIVVLGARVMPDGELSTTLLHRIQTARAVYEEGCAPLIVVCGAQGSDEPISEAAAMAAYLTENGVPEEAILREDRSTSTEENLAYAMELLKERGLQDILLVTSNYHVARALALCGDMGISATGVAAPGPLLWHNRMIARAKESLSWGKYYLKKIVK